jgi:polyhydroxybutyrate depolymerase
VSDHVRRTIWDSCRDDVEVRYYVVHGGGHTWPGIESDGPLGHSTGELGASKEMWRFFSRFSREPAGR